MSIPQAPDICLRDKLRETAMQGSDVFNTRQRSSDDFSSLIRDVLSAEVGRTLTSCIPSTHSQKILNCLLKVLCSRAEAMLIPATMPTLELKYSHELPIAISQCSIPAVRATNTAEIAIHCRIRRERVDSKRTYLLIIKSVGRPPIALPITEGIKWAPALVCSMRWDLEIQWDEHYHLEQ
jgi:hypothetical protein